MRTRPSRRLAARPVWPATAIGPIWLKEPPAGSYSSAEASGVEPSSVPPAMRTRPSASNVAVWAPSGDGSEPAKLKVPAWTATADCSVGDAAVMGLGLALGVTDGPVLELAPALDTAPAFVWKRSQTPDRITAATNVTTTAPAAVRILTAARLRRGASP